MAIPLPDWLARWVSRGNAIWTVLGWLGWRSVVASAATFIAGGVGAIMQSVPLSIALMAAFCAAVAMLFLAQLPAFIRATQTMRPQERPDPDVWRHVPRLKLYEAACLLANVQPKLSEAAKGDAYGWYTALKHAVDTDKMPYIHTRFDSQHTFYKTGLGTPYYEAYPETLIERGELQKFAKSRQVQRAFLSDA
jgi:hypothetical protein